MGTESQDTTAKGKTAAPTTPKPLPLDTPGLFINRELSHLEFNRRVLAQALDIRTPLLERLRFLTICSTNLDEFFEVRVAGLKQRIAFGLAHAGPDGLTPTDALAQIRDTAHELISEQYRVLNEVILPELGKEGVFLHRRSKWTPDQQEWLKEYFVTQVLPILTPMALDPAHPFPRIINKSLNFAVWVEGDDAFGRSANFAVVHVPRCLPRTIVLPTDSVGTHEFVMLSSIIHAHIELAFPGMSVKGCFQFRVTRNSNLWVDEEEVEDLLKALKGELVGRNFGAAVRIEVADNISRRMAKFLLEKFGLTDDDQYQVDGPVNLHRLAAIYNQVKRPDLKYKPFLSGIPPALSIKGADLFEEIRAGDILLHHPYESFAPVLGLVQMAAADPDVLAIKQTLYRSGARSPLVTALVEAARAGKEVTAIVELRARFDEAANIGFATRLQEAGANVVYGIVGYKTHAKMLMIVRREGKKLRRYIHTGTGNYHTGTAKAYTDFSLFTADKRIGEDMHRLFLQLTGLGKLTRMRKILQSPFTLRQTLVELIDREAAHAKAGKPAYVRAKMNSLSEPSVIKALYRASRAGVPIDLIVRGICRLRPGIPGVSENIRVRSIVGRFLEHSRVYNFCANGQDLTYIASADWMSRNLRRRVEQCVPVEDDTLRRRVIAEALEIPLSDNTQAWQLNADGKYTLASPGPQESPITSQTKLLQTLSRMKV